MGAGRAGAYGLPSWMTTGARGLWAAGEAIS